MQKKKKLIKLIILILILFSSFLLISFYPHNYTYKYKLGKASIVEKYDKGNKSYVFVIDIDNYEYKYSFESKYLRKRGIIKSIQKSNDCIDVNTKSQDFSVCQKANDYTTAYYSDKFQINKIDDYKNVEIYELLNHKYYIWNYTGFLSINKDEKKLIKLFENDVYELKIITPINQHLLIADYDQEYAFDKMYLLNTKNNNVSDVLLKKKVYFNSYILGTYKKDVYLYDAQKEKEYKINPFKASVEKFGYKVLVDGEWEKASLNKLNKKEAYFEGKDLYNFFTKNNKLYYKMIENDILITNLQVSNLVFNNEKEAYFVSGESLYYVNLHKGIKKIMSYSEWNFNNKNIYIF